MDVAFLEAASLSGLGAGTAKNRVAHCQCGVMDGLMGWCGVIITLLTGSSIGRDSACERSLAGGRQ